MRQSRPQRKFNRFCENWLFAFIVAMAIRHVVVEPYNIPTASMEPMLYGDSSFFKADLVVVDKLGFRFTGPERWGVTVFQFPWPEIAGPGGMADARRVWTEDGGRRDSFPAKPLLNRNFVKRCVAMPGMATVGLCRSSRRPSRMMSGCRSTPMAPRTAMCRGRALRVAR
jgi:signal peptidase I